MHTNKRSIPAVSVPLCTCTSGTWYAYPRILSGSGPKIIYRRIRTFFTDSVPGKFNTIFFFLRIQLTFNGAEDGHLPGGRKLCSLGSTGPATPRWKA
eukprot:SAG11_NODE_15336_length_581_cov_2.168050_1_plen_96_part_10